MVLRVCTDSGTPWIVSMLALLHCVAAEFGAVVRVAGMRGASGSVNSVVVCEVRRRGEPETGFPPVRRQIPVVR